MTRFQTNQEITMHDVLCVEIAEPVGHTGRRWLSVTITHLSGLKTDLVLWGNDEAAPEVILEDEVSVRRVQTVGEGE